MAGTRGRLFTASIVSLITLGLAGCASVQGEDNPSESAEEPTEVVPSEPDVEQLVIPEGVSARGVVLAALLLANGDIARAVEEGLVSPDEVEIAREAVAGGTLQQWVEAAEGQ